MSMVVSLLQSAWAENCFRFMFEGRLTCRWGKGPRPRRSSRKLLTMVIWSGIFPWVRWRICAWGGLMRCRAMRGRRGLLIRIFWRCGKMRTPTCPFSSRLKRNTLRLNSGRTCPFAIFDSLRDSFAFRFCRPALIFACGGNIRRRMPAGTPALLSGARLWLSLWLALRWRWDLEIRWTFWLLGLLACRCDFDKWPGLLGGVVFLSRPCCRLRLERLAIC